MTGVTLPEPATPFKLGEPFWDPGPELGPDDFQAFVAKLTPVTPWLTEAEWLGIGQAVQDPTFLAGLTAWANYQLCDEPPTTW